VPAGRDNTGTPAASQDGGVDSEAAKWEALRRANTADDAVDASDRSIGIEVALFHCEDRLGGSWVHAPGRWATSDGCVPARIVWAYFSALSMGRAVDAITTARGIGLAFGGGDEGARARSAIFDEAYPPRR
jgi:hypothetical protein